MTDRYVVIEEADWLLINAVLSGIRSTIGVGAKSYTEQFVKDRVRKTARVGNEDLDSGRAYVPVAASLMRDKT